MRPVIPLAALALLATIVTGREQPLSPEPVAPARQHNAQAVAPPQELDLDKLVRQRHERSVTDLFAARAFVPPTEPKPRVAPAPEPAPAATPAPAAEPAPPVVPVAPPLPFAYLGRMVKGERAVAYVLKGEQMHLAEAGHMLGEDYRVEGVTDSAVHFLYIPLGTKQVLSFPVRE